MRPNTSSIVMRTDGTYTSISSAANNAPVNTSTNSPIALHVCCLCDSL
jgi:hypothetical protein